MILQQQINDGMQIVTGVLHACSVCTGRSTVYGNFTITAQHRASRP